MFGQIKSRFDPSKYPTEAYQFFYGSEEPYYIDNSFTFPIIRNVVASTISLDLVSVRPLDPPNELYYHDRMIESLSAAAAAISNHREGAANYLIVSPQIAEELRDFL